MATYLFWDPVEDNILQERDGTGALVAEYTTEPSLYGNVISQNRGGPQSQFHYDAQGSTLAVIDDSQQVTATRAYSAFGVTTESTGSTAFPFQYIGKNGLYFDHLVGEYLARGIPYEPAIIRFLAILPSNRDGAKVYSRNQPIGFASSAGTSFTRNVAFGPEANGDPPKLPFKIVLVTIEEWLRDEWEQSGEAKMEWCERFFGRRLPPNADRMKKVIVRCRTQADGTLTCGYIFNNRFVCNCGKDKYVVQRVVMTQMYYDSRDRLLHHSSREFAEGFDCDKSRADSHVGNVPVGIIKTVPGAVKYCMLSRLISCCGTYDDAKLDKRRGYERWNMGYDRNLISCDSATVSYLIRFCFDSAGNVVTTTKDFPGGEIEPE